MNNKFDELTKGLAQSVTRRAALKKFGVGLAGVVLATLGLANKAEAQSGSNCVEWACHDRRAGWHVHICGGGRPHYNKQSVTCVKSGIVDCAFCPGCC